MADRRQTRGIPFRCNSAPLPVLRAPLPSRATPLRQSDLEVQVLGHPETGIQQPSQASTQAQVSWRCVTNSGAPRVTEGCARTGVAPLVVYSDQRFNHYGTQVRWGLS